MASRSNGTVTKTSTSSSAGNGAIVTYPEQPSPVVYTGIPEAHFKQFCRAQDAEKQIDVETDGSNNVTGTGVH